MVKKLLGTLNNFNSFNVLLLGDFMLDLYTSGQINRISPEAPVPIFNAKKNELKPGGAGNVALNLKALGGFVTVMGVVGEDDYGDILKKRLTQAGIDISGLISDSSFATPVKNRIIASNQQLMRIDHEEILSLKVELEEHLISLLPSVLDGIDIVSISDYGKGFLTANLLSNVIKAANDRKIPVVVDPKGNDFSKYKMATVVKPNFKEAILASNTLSETPLDEIAEKLFEQTQAEHIMITRSEKGISLFSRREGMRHFPTTSRDVRDVTGAGDTVLAILTAAFANKLDFEAIVNLSNVAGSIAVKHLGCIHVTLSDLARAMFKKDSYNKIFEEDHLFALQEVLREDSFTILGLYSKDGLTPLLFNTLKDLSAKNNLIVYVRDEEPDKDVVSTLTSFKEVNFVILKSKNLHSLCEVLHPSSVFVLENNKLASRNLSEAFSK